MILDLWRMKPITDIINVMKDNQKRPQLQARNGVQIFDWMQNLDQIAPICPEFCVHSNISTHKMMGGR